MLIKVARITNLTDARYFAAKEVDFLGFNFEEGTEGYLDPMYMKAIREWVTGPKIVGEFSRSSPAYVRESAAFFGLDAVQLTTDYISQLAVLEGLDIILEIGENEQGLMREAAAFVSFFLMKMNTGSTGLLPEQIRFLKNLCAEYPVLLQTDAAAEQLSGLLEVIQPAGLSLVGGDELLVGVKSFDEIEAIFEVLGK